MTPFAAQTDFTEGGEVMLFVDESQADYLENLMWDQGYLDTYQMAGALQMLRSNDLIWSRTAHGGRDDRVDARSAGACPRPVGDR